MVTFVTIPNVTDPDLGYPSALCLPGDLFIGFNQHFLLWYWSALGTSATPLGTNVPKIVDINISWFSINRTICDLRGRFTKTILLKNKSKKYGLDLMTEIQQVLACKNIILFKDYQFDQELLKSIDAEEHAINIKASIMKDTIKTDDAVYSDLTAILRGVNEKTNRRDLKIQLNKLYERASEDDSKLIEVFSNLSSKLPNFEKLETIGELELTTNFLDLIFSPLFHHPTINKHFIWLNRQDENTGGLRPDGVMISVPKKAESITLGYCEVKAQDVEASSELAFADLVRLSIFSRDLMLRKENKKAISIQAIGYRVIIYFIEEAFPSVTIMSEILSFDVPRTICDIAGLVNKMDQLKRVCHALDTECRARYKYPRPLTDDIKVGLNPKRRKLRTPSFSLL
ncbi:hypothetical protein K501DRAFT_328517 [Backusella circina FSU 941]|nr:hypothetical protein K501DRAFT_328517 [Backusella circina FSU 941]